MFAWFPLGDLLRKLGDGDPRLVLVRDVLLVLGSIALIAKYAPWRDVTVAFRGWWLPLALCFLYFGATGAQSINSWQIPLSGLRLYFGFLPLLAVGWVVGRDPVLLRRTLLVVCTVLCLGSLLGVFQAVIGPDFLAPPRSLDYFRHLDLQRITVGQIGPAVFQPSGPFVETGRFANWALITFVAGLALVGRRDLGRARFMIVTIGAAALMASSGRTVILAAIVLAIATAVWRYRAQRRTIVRSVAAFACMLVPLVAVGYLLAPQEVESRAEYLSLSLNPLSGTSEITQRPIFYPTTAFRAIGVGGLFGRGVGAQSLGTQYLQGVARPNTFGEGGFSTVAVETGFLGLVAWVAWTWTWCRKLRLLKERASRENALPVAVIGFAVTLVFFVLFWLGINAIQDFVLNGFVFFSTGLAMALATAAETVEGDRSVDDWEVNV